MSARAARAASGPGWRLGRISVVREAPPEGLTDLISSTRKVRGPEQIARVMHALTYGSPVEQFWAFHLDTRHAVHTARLVTQGILDASLIHPREVFSSLGAMCPMTSAIIVAHNHPSGDPTPSPEDRAVTRQLAEAGRILGVPLLDHVVVGFGDSGDVMWRVAGDVS